VVITKLYALWIKPNCPYKAAVAVAAKVSDNVKIAEYLYISRTGRLKMADLS